MLRAQLERLAIRAREERGVVAPLRLGAGAARRRGVRLPHPYVRVYAPRIQRERSGVRVPRLAHPVEPAQHRAEVAVHAVVWRQLQRPLPVRLRRLVLAPLLGAVARGGPRQRVLRPQLARDGVARLRLLGAPEPHVAVRHAQVRLCVLRRQPHRRLHARQRALGVATRQPQRAAVVVGAAVVRHQSETRPVRRVGLVWLTRVGQRVGEVEVRICLRLVVRCQLDSLPEGVRSLGRVGGLQRETVIG
mmetsp:Transcript_24836/g.79431  ORF Transcript_24836/g.79431 Transcript_24836/m.79431 type:complete len:247 (-) Transcript_24836:250-990(-)